MFAEFETIRTVSRAQRWDGTLGGATAIMRYARDQLPALRPVLYVAAGHDHPLRRRDELEHVGAEEVPRVDAPAFLVIPTLEGDMRADAGDWIIRGLVDELYPCKPDVFRRKYQSVSATPARSREGRATIEFVRGGEVYGFALDTSIWGREETRHALEEAARRVVAAAYGAGRGE